MRIIAITGGPTTGKSTLARFLAARGWPVCDTDALMAALYQTPEIKDIVQGRFGLDAFRPDGQIDTARLQAYALAHPAVFAWREQVFWPRVSERARLWLFGQERRGAGVVFVATPRPFVAAAGIKVSEYWRVTAPRALRLEWLQVRDHQSPRAAQQWLRCANASADVHSATVQITNNDTLPALEQQLETVLRERGLAA